MTVLYDSPIFGPIHSRRLGVSLGINLLPHDGKCCTFDCIYCECGFNHDFVAHDRMPSRQQVSDALRQQLQKMQQEGPQPDVLTFAGNGEPTMHPHFPEIVDDVIALRNEYFPKAKVSVLSNATQILRQPVFEALKKVDNNILKLDTVSNAYIHRLDRPVSSSYDVEKLVAKMAEFDRHCIVQTMFLTPLTSLPPVLSSVKTMENSPLGPKEYSIPSAIEIAHEAGASCFVSSLLSGSSGDVAVSEEST